MARKSAKQTRLDALDELRSYMAECKNIIEDESHPGRPAVVGFTDDLIALLKKHREGGESDD